jgi:hypothetical protein
MTQQMPCACVPELAQEASLPSDWPVLDWVSHLAPVILSKHFYLSSSAIEK